MKAAYVGDMGALPFVFPLPPSLRAFATLAPFRSSVHVRVRMHVCTCVVGGEEVK